MLRIKLIADPKSKGSGKGKQTNRVVVKRCRFTSSGTTRILFEACVAVNANDRDTDGRGFLEAGCKMGPPRVHDIRGLLRSWGMGRHQAELDTSSFRQHYQNARLRVKDCKGLPLPERLWAVSNLAALVKPYLAALHSVFICCRAQDPEIAFVTNVRGLHACFLKECNLMAL